MSQKSDIPFGAQFSPRQVNLPKLLQIISDNAGNRHEITEAIRDEFFSQHAEDQRWKIANNTVLALRAYELLDKEGASPTALATNLLKSVETPGVLYEQFAKHILENLKGIVLVETLDAMQSAGEKITLYDLRKRLEQRTLYVPRGTVHLSSMRLWLAQAGVFDPAVKGGLRLYQVDKARLNQILGIGLDAIDLLTQLRSCPKTTSHF